MAGNVEMSGIRFSLKSWVASIIAALLCLLVYPATAAAEDDVDLSRLSDVELYFHGDPASSWRLLEERRRSYTEEELAASQRAIREESARRAEARENRPARELLEDMKTAAPGDDAARGLAIYGFGKAFSRADSSEKAATRAQFVADWEAVSYPSIAERDKASIHERNLFRMYLTEAASLCDSEDELLAMLGSRCLNREIEGGMLLYLEGLAGHDTPAGPKVAARVEALFAECHTWDFTELGYSDRADAMPYLYGALAACGRNGLEVLLRLGKESTGPGISMLSYMDYPETEEILWDLYQEKNGYLRLTILSALIEKQSRRPIEERRQLLREEIVDYLSIPDGEISLVHINRVVQIAASTEDPWFLPHVAALEDVVKNIDVARIAEYREFPETLAGSQMALQRVFENAKKSFLRAEQEQQEAGAAN